VLVVHARGCLADCVAAGVSQDDAVPVGVSEQVFELLGCEEMALTLVKDGDHRLSRPQDIRLLLSTLDNLRVLVLSKQEH
jgi:hypothetical protein